MPVSILGMHRSGTSMVALLLAECGLYLGPEDDLMLPAPDNPAGFGENLRFVELNEQLLAEVGGDWDCVPEARPGWLESNSATELQAHAEELVHEFAGLEPWGWKDPRNSITLPFWERITGPIEVVVCVRDPLEVALSLRRRNGATIGSGLTLWLDYNERILATTNADSRIVTHYDAYFRSPRSELERVAAFINLPADAATLARAAGRAQSSLRSYRLRRPYLLRDDVSTPVAELYRTLCAEARSDARDPVARKPRAAQNQPRKERRRAAARRLAG